MQPIRPAQFDIPPWPMPGEAKEARGGRPGCRVQRAIAAAGVAPPGAGVFSGLCPNMIPVSTSAGWPLTRYGLNFHC